jgi:hypothetical protein
MHPPKLRTFSNVTPIVAGMVTMVDLSDTTRPGPLVAVSTVVPQQLLAEASAEELSDQSVSPFTHDPTPMIDLSKRNQIRESSSRNGPA